MPNKSDAASREFLQRLKVVECPDATYVPKDHALVFAKGLGSKVWDVAGNEFLDLCAGFGVLALGHNHPELNHHVFDKYSEAVKIPPVMHGMGDVYPSQAKVELLEAIRKILPKHLTHGALALTGSQAVEIAIKTAILATKKSQIISFADAYHGVDLGILPVTAREDFSSPFKGWLKADLSMKLPYGCDEKIVRAAIEKSQTDLAGIIVEPIQGRAGVVIPPAGWLAMLRRLCDEYKMLLIFDEIFVGLGRTGRMTWAEEVACDLLCLGKALGGGMPLSVCFGTTAAMKAWPESKGEAIHTGTFFGHPLSCEFAIQSLVLIQKQNLISRSKTLGEKAAKYLREKIANPKVHIRGAGLMLAIEFDEAGKGAMLMDKLRQQGVIALASGAQGQTLTVSPALNIPEDELMAGLDKICHLS